MELFTPIGWACKIKRHGRGDWQDKTSGTLRMRTTAGAKQKQRLRHIPGQFRCEVLNERRAVPHECIFVEMAQYSTKGLDHGASRLQKGVEVCGRGVVVTPGKTNTAQPHLGWKAIARKDLLADSLNVTGKVPQVAADVSARGEMGGSGDSGGSGCSRVRVRP